MNLQMISRRKALSSSVAAVTAAVASNSHAAGQLVYQQTDWNAKPFDALVKAPARIKQCYDVSQVGEGMFLNNIKNSLNGLHFGFGIPVGEIKVVAALHGPVNMLNFDDHIWQKYAVGEWLAIEDPKTKAPAIRNIFYPSLAADGQRYASDDPNNESSLYQDKSVQGLQRRGVQFLSCHTAMEEQGRLMVKRMKLDEPAEQVVREMLAHALPGVLVVPSMVSAIALLQTEGSYSYIKV